MPTPSGADTDFAPPMVTAPQGSAALEHQPGGPEFATNWTDQFQQGLFRSSKELGSWFRDNAARYGLLGPNGEQVFPPSADPEADIEDDQHAAELERNQRASVAQRYGGGTVGRLTAGLAADALDPVNLGAALMPGVGEEFLASRLGAVAGRAVSGATAGIAGQVPLSALHMAEDPDYGWHEAVTDLAAGALLGAGLHSIAGALGSSLDHRMERLDLPPSVDAAAERTASAQLAEDLPVEVRPVVQPFAQPKRTAPQSLGSFLVGKGGLVDEAGELSAMDAGRRRPGIVSGKGLSLDYAREAAEEAGFLPPDSSTADLLNAVSEEMQGRRVYRPEEQAQISGEAAQLRGESQQAEFEHTLASMRDEPLVTAEERHHAAYLVMEGMSHDQAVEEAERAGIDAIHGTEADRAAYADRLRGMGYLDPAELDGVFQKAVHAATGEPEMAPAFEPVHKIDASGNPDVEGEVSRLRAEMASNPEAKEMLGLIDQQGAGTRENLGFIRLAAACLSRAAAGAA